MRKCACECGCVYICERVSLCVFVRVRARVYVCVCMCVCVCERVCGGWGRCTNGDDADGAFSPDAFFGAWVCGRKVFAAISVPFIPGGPPGHSSLNGFFALR